MKGEVFERKEILKSMNLTKEFSVKVINYNNRLHSTSYRPQAVSDCSCYAIIGIKSIFRKDMPFPGKTCT